MSQKIKVKVNRNESIWALGRLFTIGFCQLSFGKAVLAILIWPYYLGKLLAGCCLGA